MSYDVMKLVQAEERDDPERIWFAVEPSKLYPKTIARIREVLAGEDQPSELIDKVVNVEIDPTSAARQLLRMARDVPGKAWEDAVLPRGDFADDPADERVVARAKALEAARLWFTRALKNETGPGIGLHILRDEAYRLEAAGF